MPLFIFYPDNGDHVNVRPTEEKVGATGGNHPGMFGRKFNWTWVFIFMFLSSLYV